MDSGIDPESTTTLLRSKTPPPPVDLKAFLGGFCTEGVAITGATIFNKNEKYGTSIESILHIEYNLGESRTNYI